MSIPHKGDRFPVAGGLELLHACKAAGIGIKQVKTIIRHRAGPWSVSYLGQKYVFFESSHDDGIRLPLMPVHGECEDEDADHDRPCGGLHKEVHAHGRANGENPAWFRHLEGFNPGEQLRGERWISRPIIALIQGKMGTRRGGLPFPDAMENGPRNEPSEVVAEEGEVMMDGPGGYTISFTPEAALETSERLLLGGLEAQGQILEAKRRAGKDGPE